MRLVAVCLVVLSSLVSAQTTLSSEEVASGLLKPVWAGAPPGDARVFIVEQHTGRIRIAQSGSVLSPAFLSIGSKIDSLQFERGLLSMAFHPDYASNGYFFVFYTRASDGAIVVERYEVSAGDPNMADATSGTIMLGPIAHEAPNHNGGMLQFDSDGYLLVSIGDNDGPPCNALNGSVVFGKILRIDVDNGGVAAPGNPFLGNPSFDDRIWAYGLRNPWRFSLDSENGDLYIGDVGEAQREEINWVSGVSVGGENYGWNVMEGTLCTGETPCTGVTTPPCNDPSLVMPVYEYDHGAGCSVSGGVVYRGCAIPDLRGTYFFSDWCTSPIMTLRMDGGLAVDVQDRTSEISAGVWNIASFGADGDGEVLIVGNGSGSVWRVVPSAAGADRWVNEGFALAGVAGDPLLEGTGALSAGSSNSLDLSSAASSATAALFVSVTSTPVPFKGGTLVPVPFFTPTILPTNVAGAIAIPFTMPSGVPACTELWFQWAIQDAVAVNGVSLTNALRAVTP